MSKKWLLLELATKHPLNVILQLLPGHVFNIEAQRQALRNLDSLSLFSNIEVHPLPDEKQEGGIAVGIKLKEDKQTKTGGFAKLPVAWHGFLPTLDSILPGGNVSFICRNIEGLNISIIGSVLTISMLNPQFGHEGQVKHFIPDLINEALTVVNPNPFR
ncbi:protein TOC75-3, chloroplastic, partial [Tanacetum coccineum]